MTFEGYLSKNKLQKYNHTKKSHEKVFTHCAILVQFKELPLNTMCTFKYSYHKVIVTVDSQANCEIYQTS